MTDTINLQKGQRLSLSKEAPGSTAFYIGLGWTPSTTQGVDFDLDASAFPCLYNSAGDPELVSPPHFVFYNNTVSPCGGVVHSGDNLTGDGDGDDEVIRVYLDKVDTKVEEISFIVTIHEAVARRQNFGQVRKAYIRICEMDANGDPTNQIAIFELEEDASSFTACQFGQLYKKNGEWKFNAIGQGYNADLSTIVHMYAPAVQTV